MERQQNRKICSFCSNDAGGERFCPHCGYDTMLQTGQQRKQRTRTLEIPYNASAAGYPQAASEYQKSKSKLVLPLVLIAFGIVMIAALLVVVINITGESGKNDVLGAVKGGIYSLIEQQDDLDYKRETRQTDRPEATGPSAEDALPQIPNPTVGGGQGPGGSVMTP